MQAFTQSVRNNGGFTLVEVLVATLILSFGLLGLAALQIGSLRHNQSSHQRGQATVIGYELADRIRANRDAAVAGDYTLTATRPSVNDLTDCSATSCDSDELADYDLYVWWTGDTDLDGTADQVALETTLPDALAIVTCDTVPCTDASTHTVTVMWNDVVDYYDLDAQGATEEGGAGLAQRLAVDVSHCQPNDRVCHCIEMTCFHVNFQP